MNYKYPNDENMRFKGSLIIKLVKVVILFKKCDFSAH
jgi:hypothetical protein